MNERRSLKTIAAVVCVYLGGFGAAKVRDGHGGWIVVAAVGTIGALVVVLWLEDRLGK